MFQRLLGRGLPPLIVALFAAAGSYMLLAAVAADPWEDFARTIEASATPPSVSDRTIERLERRVTSNHGRLCVFNLAESRVTIGLLLMRLAEDSGSPPAVRKAADDAASAIRDAIACHPRDSNLWSVLALAELRRGVEVRRLSSLIEASKALSPVDARLMWQRSAMMAGFLGRPEFAGDVRPLADFVRALTLLHAGDALSLLVRLEEAERPEITQLLLQQVPEERREILTRGVARERARLEQSKGGHRFEFTPFGG